MTLRQLAIPSSSLIALLVAIMPAVAGEVLYNGIELPDQWPPRRDGLKYEVFRNQPGLKYAAPMAVPYLEKPPAVIPIDVGRQLFVDDFLIENTNLQRTFHLAKYHPASPVLKPDRKWEQGDRGPRALVFSDGVWHDPQDRLFKMWYLAYNTCYAVSKDGIHWEKPQLDVEPGTNIVLKHRPPRDDNATVCLDLAEKDPSRRYKMFVSRHVPTDEVLGNNSALLLHFSKDGIHWSKPVWESVVIRDRSTVFFNPFRKVWVDSIKVRPTVPVPQGRLPLTRSRAYREHKDVTAPWRGEEIVPWVGADKLDLNRNQGIDLETLGGQHLYNLDAVAYESVLLGMFSIYHGNGTGPGRRHHMNDVTLGFSRDGFHWHRPDRRAFLGVGQKRSDWNWTNVQSAGGCCLVVGDELHFYCSGRGHDENGRGPEVLSTGLATLRRDGFASLDAGPQGGVLITRPVKFSGKHLFVNVDCPDGDLRVDVLHPEIDNFREKREPVIEPFTQARCVPLRADRTRQRVEWEGVKDLLALSGKPVRFRFHLRSGRLYAFWVSASESGASGGYVAAGGPGFTGPTDTVGGAAPQR